MIAYEDLEPLYQELIDKDAFKRFALKATADINYFTFDRVWQIDLKAKSNAEIRNKTIQCLIELIGLYAENEASKSAIKSEAVGNYKIEYANATSLSSADFKAQKEEIVRRYFAQTGLMYRGVAPYDN